MQAGAGRRIARVGRAGVAVDAGDERAGVAGPARAVVAGRAAIVVLAGGPVGDRQMIAATVRSATVRRAGIAIVTIERRTRLTGTVGAAVSVRAEAAVAARGR